MFNNFKKAAALTGAIILTISSVFSCLSVNTVSVNADEQTTAADTESQSSEKKQTYTVYKFADINLQVSVPDELVCFTQNVTSANQNLELIGASSPEELRSLMQLNNIYLEAVPSENVNYEIIIDGKELSSKDIMNLSDLSEKDLNDALEDYVKDINKKNDNVTETLNDYGIYKNNDTTYFMTDVTSVSETLVTVKVLKYYTIVDGRYITFTLQAKTNEITDKMRSQLESIINSAEYKEIKKSIFDDPVLSEIVSSIFTLFIPIGLLGLILFLLIRSSKKHKI